MQQAAREWKLRYGAELGSDVPATSSAGLRGLSDLPEKREMGPGMQRTGYTSMVKLA